jgi:hypothetical protein
VTRSERNFTNELYAYAVAVEFNKKTGATVTPKLIDTLIEELEEFYDMTGETGAVVGPPYRLGEEVFPITGIPSEIGLPAELHDICMQFAEG